MDRAPRVKYHPLIKWLMLVKPQYATGELWDRWRDVAERRHPIRYFLQETIPGMFRRSRYRFSTWIENKFHKFYTVKFERPKSTHISELSLHTNFSLFVQYVKNIGKRNHSWHEKHRPKYMPKFLWHLRKYDDAALDSLTKIVEDGDAEEDYLTLYVWWTVERPKRVSPWADTRIWGTSEEPKKYKFKFRLPNRTPSQIKSTNEAEQTELYYHEQDKAMLIRLVCLMSNATWIMY